jgi:L-seryl-tRNA(Ser) seleniumtransferase
MANRSGIQRASRSTLVLGSRLRDLTSRVRTNPAVQRVGKWFDGLQADLRGAAKERIHEAGTLAGRVARQLLAPAQSGPRSIVNATGILHLAGAELPLADAAIDELSLVARDYRAFATRPGGSQGLSIGDAALRSVESLVAELTGAQAALVFANPATAMLAVLTALAQGREVLAARSQIERLHGDFSLPAAAQAAGARLREIGTTHRSTCDEFKSALSADSGVILHSQPSEYRIAGSVAEPQLDELVQLAAEHKVPLVASLPAASLIPLHFAGAGQLPIVGQSIIAGADLVIFRGDTYVGGPPVPSSPAAVILQSRSPRCRWPRR